MTECLRRCGQVAVRAVPGPVPDRPDLHRHGAPALRRPRVAAAPTQNEQHPAHRLQLPAVRLLAPDPPAGRHRVPAPRPLHRGAPEARRGRSLQVRGVSLFFFFGGGAVPWALQARRGRPLQVQFGFS